MNKVIVINLCGSAYQLEEGGYDALRGYLDTAAVRLDGNPDRDEILADIERAIGEKFRLLLGNFKTVVAAKEVAAVIAEMGPIESEPERNTGASETTASGGQAEIPGSQEGRQSATPRRLYRILEGAMIAGVCNGVAGYFNTDPTFVRLAFVLLTLVWGAGVLVYLVMAVVVPEARSPEEKAAASGIPATAQEFIERAKAGYYGALKGFQDRKARREWWRRAKRDLRQWRASFESEMRANADQWQRNWHGYWAEHAPHPASSALPFISLVHGAATILLLCAVVSLLATGAVLGARLPSDIPAWMAVLFLLIAYGFFTWPLKAARHASYWRYGHSGPAGGFMMLVDTLVWLGIIAILLWLAVHFLPELRGAVQSFPSLVRQATHDVRAWWNGK